MTEMMKSEGLAKKLRQIREQVSDLGRLQQGRRWWVSTVGAMSFGAMALTACQVAVQDAPKPYRSLKVARTDACLENALPVIRQYVDGKAAPDEIAGVWDCATNALDTFVKSTRGTNSGYYTDKELRAFMRVYFLGNLTVSDAFLKEIGRIKETLLGGNADRLTLDEIKRLKVIVHTLKVESLRLAPHVPYLALNIDQYDARQNARSVEEAIADFNVSVTEFGNLLGLSHSDYSLNNLEALLREFSRFYIGANAWDGPDWLIARLSLAKALKAFFVRPSGEIVKPSEWREIAVDAGKIYSAYLRWHYLLSNRDLLSGEGLDHLTRAMTDLFDVLDASVRAKPAKVIEFATIDDLINELNEARILKLGGVKAETIKKAARSILDRIFNPPVDNAPNFDSAAVQNSFISGLAGLRAKTGGLNQANLAHFREGVLGWLDMQRVWRELVNTAYMKSPGLRGKPLPLAVVREIWPTLSSPYQRSFDDLSFVIQRREPLSYSALGTVVFERKPAMHVIDQGTFDSLNWKAHLVRAVVLGYSYEPEKAKFRGITKAEWKDFFDDVRPLAVDLNMVAFDDQTIWSSLFEELNMFMFTADGDNWISYAEGLDLVSFALSSSVMSHRMYDDLLVNCEHFEPDVFGVAKVTAQCFRARWKAHFASAYRYLPAWAKLTSTFDSGDWTDFQREIELAARKKGYSGDLIETTDVDRMTMVLHYIEAILTRFDKDGSGDLSLGEARNAYPLLKSKLAAASGFTSDADLYALFTYVLHYGAAPTRTIGGALTWLAWKNSQSQWTVEADRRKILRIIGNLNSASQ